MIQPEQRKFRRHEARHLLDYLIIDGDGNPGTYSMGRTLDVCVDGLRLETIQPLHTDTRLRITVGVEGNLIDLEGRTTHSSPSENRYISGVSFLRVSKDGRRTLNKYIEALPN